jgi:AraC family transcriptional regulator of adaptative response/methylated-DNA-[protein]-cysteine methyltransferase
VKLRKKRVEKPGPERHLDPMTMHMIQTDTGSQYRRIARAIRFLSDNYLEQPRLEDAAAAAALSPYHFQRMFTRYVGISPKAFVGSLTLDHAKSELQRGASVLDAALDAGLSGPSRLHDLCLKIEAMTPGEYARGGADVAIDYGFRDCPFGTALVMVTDKGVCGIAFGDEDDNAEILADMKSRWPKAQYREHPASMRELAEKIFAPRGEGELPLHLMGTPWQVKVWQALLAIPEGRTTTYGVIAKSIGDANAARAVGTAVGRNPISWLIPCHRVLAGDGKLHGYHWGLSRKRAMLAVEAARAA